ncbi:MAG: GAF domain-containing protein, partial [Aquisalimonadaceae bacterium]
MTSRREDILPDRVDKLNELGIALSAETNTARLLERILLGARELTNADAGTLYRVTEDGRHLRFESLHNGTLGIALGGTTGEPVPFPPIVLRDAKGRPNHNNVAACAALEGRSFHVSDAYAAEDFDFSGTRRMDRETGYRSCSFLTMPLKNHEEEVVGVLQLINALDPDTGAVIPFGGLEQRLAESLASQAAVALTKKELIDGQKALFQSFIQLIATAIDRKNPTTGKHCERVPKLALMLADAALEATEGPLRDFTLTEDEYFELQVGAWLHDCGKITTPEDVLNKATKLE